MFGLDEHKALDLVFMAQKLSSHYPGLGRGMVAASLFYEWRNNLTKITKQLVQTHYNLSSCEEVPQQLKDLLANYTSTIVADGLLTNIIIFLEQWDREQEVEKLVLLFKISTAGRLCHYASLRESSSEIRAQLSIIHCYLSARDGVPRGSTLRLLDYLAEYASGGQRGVIDDLALSLIMSLVFAFDAIVFKNIDDSDGKDLDSMASNFSACVADIYARSSKSWKSKNIRSIILLAFALNMAKLRNHSQKFGRRAGLVIDKCDVAVELELHDKVFDVIIHDIIFVRISKIISILLFVHTFSLLTFGSNQ